jgi:hypothetical protein
MNGTTSRIARPITAGGDRRAEVAQPERERRALLPVLAQCADPWQQPELVERTKPDEDRHEDELHEQRLAVERVDEQPGRPDVQPRRPEPGEDHDADADRGDHREAAQDERMCSRRRAGAMPAR